MTDIVVDVGSPTTPTTPDLESVASALFESAWSHLYSGVRAERDKLAGSISAGAASLTTTYQVAGIQSGAKLSIDLEDFHVWTVVGATVTVNPGDFGSSTNDHDAGAIIHVNLEWTPFEIFREMNNELRSLSAGANGLYQVKTVTIPFDTAYYGYDLTGVSNVDDIVSVITATSGVDLDQVRLRPGQWRIERNLDTAVFPSGKGLFTDAGFSGQDMIVAYKAPFTPLTDLTQNVEATTGLPYSAHDILAMGAAIRCAAPAEIDRNRTDTQSSGRRSSEVPAGARVNAIRGLADLRRKRIVEERDRLARQNPTYLVRRGS